MPLPFPDLCEAVWRERAAFLLAAVRPVLDFAREADSFEPTPDALSRIVGFHSIGSIVDRHILLTGSPGSGGCIPLPKAPDLTAGLRHYLAETPGYDASRPCADQPSPNPERHHGLVLFTARAMLRDQLA